MSSTEPHSISNRYRQRRGKVEKRQKADKKQQFEVAVEQQENAAGMSFQPAQLALFVLSAPSGTLHMADALISARVVPEQVPGSSP